MRRRVHLLAALALAAAGCLTEPTEVLVQIDTDIPGDIPLVIGASARAGTVDITDDTFEHSWTRGPGDGGLAPPATFAITPGATNARDATLTLLVEAVGPGFVLRRRARFAFTPGRTRSLEIFLSGRCLIPFTGCTAANCTVAEYCDEQNETCDGQGSCVAIVTTTTPGEPVGADASTFEFRDGTMMPSDVPTDAPGDVRTDAPADAPACGPGRPCCSPAVACTAPQICTTGGACATCGAGQACCASGTACTAGHVCDASNACVACGASGQPCCAGGACSGAGTCTGGTCVAATCGADGQPCCGTGAACMSGLACGGGTCACEAVGARCATGDACCSPSSCNTLNSDGLLHCCLTDSDPCTSSHDCCGALVCCNLGGATGLVCHSLPCP